MKQILGGRHSHGSVPVLLCFALFSSTWVGAAAAEDQIKQRSSLVLKIAQLVKDDRIAGAKASVAVIDVPSGEPIIARHPHDRMPIASTLKIVTAYSALSHLGPEYRFKTELYAIEPIEGLLNGDLYLKGFGDPTLSERDLWWIADRLYDRGLRAIAGSIVIDETYFDAEKEAPLFATRPNVSAAFRAATGALSFARNAITISIQPAAIPGEPARVRVRPWCDYIDLTGEVVTGQKDQRSRVGMGLSATPNRMRVKVSGRMRLGQPEAVERRRIEDPGQFTASALIRQLQQRGIQVNADALRRGTVPKDAMPILKRLSDPLSTILRAMNKYSSNFIAEQLMKTIGATVFGVPGSTENGLTATAHLLAAAGLPADSYVMRNASGLYEASEFSAGQIAYLLRLIYRDFRFAADFVASLSVAGVDGTLGNRYRAAKAKRLIRAKTGTLNEVVSLSGYAGHAGGGGPAAFSILLSELPQGRITAARSIVDQIAAAVVDYLAAGHTAVEEERGN